MAGDYKSYKQTKRNEQELQILNNSNSESGYRVKSPNKSAEQGDNWNAILSAAFGTDLKLWVYDVNMDFSISGSTGQSRYRREFYPKSFNQPTMTVKGQMANQFEYNRLAAFVRETHLEALTSNSSLYITKQRQGRPKVSNTASSSLQTVKLLIRRSPKQMGGVGKIRRNLKGAHRDIVLEGYIKNITAGAMKFNFAPEFQFDFIVAASYLTGSVGIYDEDLVVGSQLMNWNDQLKKNNYGQQKFVSNQSSTAEPAAPANEIGPPTDKTVKNTTLSAFYSKVPVQPSIPYRSAPYANDMSASPENAKNFINIFNQKY